MLNVGKTGQSNIGQGRFGNVNLAMELMAMYKNGHGIFGHVKKGHGKFVHGMNGRGNNYLVNFLASGQV